MLRPYASALRVPGAARFSAAGMVARCTMAMSGLGIVLLVEDRTSSYGLAGAVVAAFTLAAAVGGPVLSRFIDRHGQSRIVPWLLSVYASAMTLFIVAVQRDWATPGLLALAAVAGGCAPQVGSLVRARWSHALSGDPRMRAAFAWESLVEESFFVIGPVVATLLALNLRTDAPLIAVVVLTTVGTAWLMTQRRTEPVPHGTAQIGGTALRQRGMTALVLGFISLGMVFAGFEVTTIAFAEEQQVRSLTGVLLGAYAAGSMLAAIWFGAVQVRHPWRTQFAVAMTCVAIFLLPMPVIAAVVERPVLPLGVMAFVAGFAVSPSLISGFALAESLVPSARVTEGLAWVSTGIGLGLAAASALTGAIIDTAGAWPAYGLTAGAGVAGAVVAWIGWSRAAVTPRASFRVPEQRATPLSAQD